MSDEHRIGQQRHYTVSEIVQMREAVRWSYPLGLRYEQRDRDADIEDRLRTYMQNGTTPEELLVAFQPKQMVMARIVFPEAAADAGAKNGAEKGKTK